MPPPPPSGSDLPTVSTTARGVVVRTNQAWCQLCGYTESEVVGRTLKCIQGPGTDQVALRQLMEAVQAGRPVRVTLVNYASDGSAFRHVVDVVPESCGHLFRATSFDVVRMNALCRALSSVDAIDISMQDFPGQEVDTCPSMLARWERGNSYSLSLPSLPLLPLSRPLLTPQPMVHHLPLPNGPATIPISMDNPDSLVVVTSCASPYPVLWASDAWLRMCDFSADELTGRSLRCIQGVGTDRQQLARLSEAAEAGVAVDNVRALGRSDERSGCLLACCHLPSHLPRSPSSFTFFAHLPRSPSSLTFLRSPSSLTLPILATCSPRFIAEHPTRTVTPVAPR